MQDPILSVQNLSVSFRSGGGWKRVVNDASFEVGAGETLAIVGESGSGKSVTAMAVMGLHPRERVRVEGSARFGGRNLLELTDDELRAVRGKEVAMIFQEPMTSMNPVLSIGRQIGEVLSIHRGLTGSVARAEATRLLDRVRIPAAATRLDDYPHQFSGGMRQRAMIAMALAGQPKLLVADEPTTALDVTIQAQIVQLLRDLQREERMAVVFITHDMGVVAETADRTLVMFRGDVLEAQPTGDLFRSPRTEYARKLLAAVPRIRDAGGLATVLPPAAASNAEPVLDVRGLTTRFDVKGGILGRVRGRVHAVENVSFKLCEGETLSLVGESGCGKSTTGRSIMGLIKPTGGSVRVGGTDASTVATDGARARAHSVQMVFQDPYASLNPRMRVGRSVAEPMVVNGLAKGSAWRSEVASLFEQVGLVPDMMDRYPHEFSGGQRQRICIARALSVRPKVIVADEAVSALDVSVQAQVVELLSRLQETHRLSYLFISHDMAVVERVSHRVAVMFLGEIVEIGPCAAVFGDPRHPYTRRLLSAIPVPDPERRGLRPRIPELELRNPVRAPDYVPPARQYLEAAPGHFVMDWRGDGAWENPAA